MARGMDVIGRKSDASTYCEECKVLGHTHSSIMKETLTHSNEVLGHVFSNVCEVQTVTSKGFQYFITFINDYFQYITVQPMKKKSKALDVFKVFLMEAKHQTGKN